MVRIHDNPRTITLFQVCAMKSVAENDEIEKFYEDLSRAIDDACKEDSLLVVGDFSAKLGVGRRCLLANMALLDERSRRKTARFLHRTRICAAEMAVRYAALSACRKVHP